MQKINVAIVGYGNLGRSMEKILQEKSEYNLIAIFSRRQVESPFGTKIVDLKAINDYKGKIDIVFLTLGSYCDIEMYGEKIAKNFCTIDSFDTHKKIKAYIEKLNKTALKYKTVSLCAFGWDPGLMSLERMIFQAIDQNSPCESFWGKGVSQGHSDAIRRINGVKNAIEYTLPNKEIFDKCKKLFNFSPKETDKHQRLCYVAKKEFVSKSEIEKQIVSMPNYFLGYDTKIVFGDEKDIKKRQKNMQHKGYIFKNFIVDSHKIKLQFSLSTTSNPILTASLMLMGARAVVKLYNEQKFGAYSIMDIPVKYYFENKDCFNLL